MPLFVLLTWKEITSTAAIQMCAVQRAGLPVGEKIEVRRTTSLR